MLINFDLDNWINLLKTGQGVIDSTKRTKIDKTPIILWNPNKKFNQGNWCIEANLKNGEKKIIHRGKQIHRFDDNTIEEQVLHLQNQLKESIIENDPLCYTSRRKVFGRYNTLIRIKDEDETLIGIFGFTKKRYSKLFERTSNIIQNEFAPLCLLSIKKSGQIQTYGNLAILLSNPLKLKQFLDNWKSINFEVPDFKLSTIKNDDEFDLYMYKIFKENLQPIIDPLFDLKKEIVSGIYILEKDAIISKNREKEYDEQLNLEFCENPNWLKGDKVFVELPEVDSEKRPFGILLENEMQDNKGDRKVIFKAIENGEERNDLVFTFPSKLLKKE